MNDLKNVILYKQRDFGLVFTDTFEFLKQTWKPLFRAVIIIAGPLLFLAGAAIGYGTDSLYNFNISDPDTFLDGGEVEPENLAIFFLAYFAMFLFMFIGYVLITTIVFTFLRMYREDEITEDITTSEIWAKSKQNLGKITASSIVFTILITIGSLLCLIPGIFIFVPLCMIFIVQIEEPELSFGDAFRRCFDLSNRCWWVSFALLTVMYMLVFTIGGIISLPFTVITYVEMFLEFNDYGIVQSLSAGVRMLINTLSITMFLVSIGIIYYSHRERLEGIGMQGRIENIGTESDFLPDSTGEY